jgi:invasion protein IalB
MANGIFRYAPRRKFSLATRPRGGYRGPDCRNERAKMMKTTLLTTVGIMAALATSAFAQSGQPRNQGAGGAQTQTAQPAPEGPLRTERTIFDSWVLTCQEVVGDAKSRRCSAVLSIVEEQSKQVAFLWTIGRNAAGAPTAVFTTPTGLNLTNGLDLTIGKGKPRKLVFSACDASSCEAVMPLDEGVLKEARSSEEAVASITMRDGRTVRFNIINRGFDRAVAAIRS